MTTKKRCVWCQDDPLYQQYHDQEWGVPVTNDQRLFEFLILEGAQAGLAWITILRKRESYRQAFDQFEIAKVARYSDEKIAQLLVNEDIVRNRLKIHSATKNAQVILAIQQQFGSFSNYLWRFVTAKAIQNNYSSAADIPSQTALSNAISKDLKKRGCSFVGPTIIYAFMQAIGMVNDHTTDCFRYQQCKELTV